MNIDHVIVKDIIDGKRQFLPGKKPTENEIYDHFQKAILIDGLNAEEAYLILSTLPANATKFYLSPLDKGLSGAKVYACKYDINGTKESKAFVLKLGPIDKITREYDAIENFVTPHLQGILPPIFRRGLQKGLVIQELAGLTANTMLYSLKQFIREKETPEKIISKLFKGRLGNWFKAKQLKDRFFFRLDNLFDWHLKKAPQIFDYPGWEKLKNWTAQETNCEWPDINILLNTVKIQKINSPMTIVHGDLHSQNILIDEDHDCFPIDFYWCHDNSSPLLDLVMLECSLKFLVIPHRADLRSLMKIDLILFDTAYPQVVIEQVPYRQEILKAIACISEIRKIALDFFKINFDDYRLALWMMTYVHNNNPSLNRPYLLSSLQIISSKIMPVLENRPISVENYPGPYDYIYAGKENHIIWGKTHGKLLKKVKLNENIKVLDVGCGDGLNSLYLEQRGCDVTGVDISELALKGLRNRFESNNTLIRGNYIHSDISDLQFENQFDVIVSYGLYHCLPIATRIETHTKITNHLKIDGHILFCSLIEGIPLPPNHSNERITLASEEEINALFPTRQWVRESFENDIINDKHLPLVPDHQHQVTWIVARKIA